MLVFGSYKYIQINVNNLVVLPQVRKIKNSKIEELIDSIQDKGLINPIDVVKLSYDEFQQHINFINQLWKKNVRIENFKPINGFYYVVIAGHTRVEAIKTIGKNNNCDCEVNVKVHPVHTSEEIIAIQLDENIHSEPRIEERAVAIIETYRLGLINNKWSNKAEFIQKNQSKFSRRILSEALAFANLPIEVQEYVFTNNIPFAVGVELGKLYLLIERYETDFSDSIDETEKNIKLHFAMLITKLQQVKSIKRGLSILSSHSKSLQDHFRPKEDLQQEMFDWWNDAVNRQSEIHHQYLLSEYNKASQALNSMPFEYFIEFLNLDSSLTGMNHSIDIRNLRKLYSQYIEERFLAPELKKRKM